MISHVKIYAIHANKYRGCHAVPSCQQKSEENLVFIDTKHLYIACHAYVCISVSDIIGRRPAQRLSRVI